MITHTMYTIQQCIECLIPQLFGNQFQYLHIFFSSITILGKQILIIKEMVKGIQKGADKVHVPTCI